MRYGSVCSGIEAATQAWHPLGWKPSFFSEIEDFPRAVLSHRYPDVPLHGDFTTIERGNYDPIDLLVGGTPCQSFSIAGLRGGLDDDRGNLALEYLRLAQRLRTKWLVWENVPGVLSSNGGRDFGSILGGLVELGYGFAYRVLDAQHVRTLPFPWAVPQRRRRVFVVGHLGDWRRAAAVLFDRESLSGNPSPRREAGKKVAGTLEASTGGCSGKDNPEGRVVAARMVAFGEYDCDGSASTVKSRDYKDATDLIAFDCKGSQVQFSEDGSHPTLRSMGHNNSHMNAGGHAAVAFKPSHFTRGKDGAPSVVYPPLTADADKGDQDPVIAFDTTQITSPQNYSNPKLDDPCHPFAAGAHAPAVAFDMRGREGGAMPEGPHETANIRAASGGSSRSYVAQPYSIMPMNSGKDYKARETDVAQPLMAGGPVGGNQGGDFIANSWAVRRLTPVECERLQGFPDNYTNIPWRGKDGSPDSRRYKALGNSMAVNVMGWIGERIQMVEGME